MINCRIVGRVVELKFTDSLSAKKNAESDIMTYMYIEFKVSRRKHFDQRCA